MRLDDKNQWTSFPGQSWPSIISTGLSLALWATWKSIRCIPVEIRIDRGQNLGLTARGNIAAMRPMQPRPQGSAFGTSWGGKEEKKVAVAQHALVRVFLSIATSLLETRPFRRSLTLASSVPSLHCVG